MRPNGLEPSRGNSAGRESRPTASDGWLASERARAGEEPAQRPLLGDVIPSGTRSLRALSRGVDDPEAIGFRRISIYDLDWRPSPLPNADAWRAGELDLPAGGFAGDARPGFGGACPAGAGE